MNTCIASRIRFGLALCLIASPALAFDGYGEWRGQAQFLVSEHGKPAPVAQEVVPLVIRVDPDGKVTGVSTENGCRLLGVASPRGNNVMALDVTLRECRTAGLNRRISGSVAAYPSDRRLSLQLNSIDTQARPITTYEVTASTLRR